MAAFNLLAEVREEERADKAPDADMDRRSHALVHGQDFDAVVFEALVEACKVFLITREAVEALDNDCIELAPLGRLAKIDQAVAVEHARSGLRTVGVAGDDLEPFTLGVTLA